MLHIDIYYEHSLLESLRIEKSFYIIFDRETGSIFWEAGEGEFNQRGKREKRGGEWHVWIFVQSTKSYRIPFVRPDWHVIIDGEPLLQKPYIGLTIIDKKTELLFQNYCFVCAIE